MKRPTSTQSRRECGLFIYTLERSPDSPPAAKFYRFFMHNTTYNLHLPLLLYFYCLSSGAPPFLEWFPNRVFFLYSTPFLSSLHTITNMTFKSPISQLLFKIFIKHFTLKFIIPGMATLYHYQIPSFIFTALFLGSYIPSCKTACITRQASPFHTSGLPLTWPREPFCFPLMPGWQLLQEDWFPLKIKLYHYLLCATLSHPNILYVASSPHL